MKSVVDTDLVSVCDDDNGRSGQTLGVMRKPLSGTTRICGCHRVEPFESFNIFLSLHDIDSSAVRHLGENLRKSVEGTVLGRRGPHSHSPS